MNIKIFIDFLKPSNEFWDFRLNRKGGTFTLLASEVFADYAEEPSEPVSYTHLTLPTICSV